MYDRYNSNISFSQKKTKKDNIKAQLDELSLILKTQRDEERHKPLDKLAELGLDERKQKLLKEKYTKWADKKKNLINKIKDDWEDAKEEARCLYKMTGEIIFPSGIRNFKEEITIQSAILTKKTFYLILPIKKKGNYTLQFFDETATGKRDPLIKDAYKRDFYQYTTVYQDMNITILSEQKIPVEEKTIKIEGLLTSIPDIQELGERAELGSDQKILIAYKITPCKTKQKEILKPFETIKTIKDLKKEYFGLYRHPNWFENMILAWNASTKEYETPLHLLIGDCTARTGIQGSTGKTTLIKKIMETNEAGYITNASNSTIKGLTVSYNQKGGKAKLGYLLQQERISAVDELFKRKNTGEDLQERTLQLEQLTTILDGTRFELRSGNTEDATAYPTSKIIFTGNLPDDISGIYELLDQISQPFLERCLLYIMTEEHARYIQENKEQIQLLINTEKKERTKIGELMHHLSTNLTIKIDEKEWQKVKEIYQKTKAEFKEKRILLYYEARYYAHTVKLFEGLLKINHWEELEKYLKKTKCQTKEWKIEPTEQDYNNLKEIMQNCVRSW